MAELLADDFCSDDRRGVVGAGIQHGRDAHMADMRTIADLWITNVSSTIIATRGERLVLMRTRFSGSDQGPGAFLTEVLGLVEINADERIVAIVSFDLDDIDAAFDGTRRPLPRRRSGRPRAHVVGHRGGLCRAQPARTSSDDAGLGEHRPPPG